MKAPVNLAIEISAERIAGGLLPSEALGNAIGEAICEASSGETLPEVAVWRRSDRSGAAIVRLPDKPAKPASLLGPAVDGEDGETVCYELPSEVCQWLATWTKPATGPIRFNLGERLPNDHPLVAWLIETRCLDADEIGAAKRREARSV